MRRLVDQFATDILAVSQCTMEIAWRKDWQQDPRCQPIYTGVDTSAFQKTVDRNQFLAEVGIAENATLYIHVGRLDPPKNHERLIGIFAAIAKVQPNAHLLLVGRGDNEIEQAVRSLIATHQLQNRVTLVGQRTDVPQLLQIADAMIFPSLYEGLPGAVIEACVAGTPVLGSDIPPIQEINAHFPNLVSHLSLQASNETWAHRAVQIATTPKDRAQARYNYEQSPFNMARAVESISEIWDRNHDIAIPSRATPETLG